MRRLSALKKIELELKTLSLVEQRALLARLSNLRRRRTRKKPVCDWTELYGLGKGLWRRQDAQAYVNRVREDRM
jgi:hypothetical protein